MFFASSSGSIILLHHIIKAKKTRPPCLLLFLFFLAASSSVSCFFPIAVSAATNDNDERGGGVGVGRRCASCEPRAFEEFKKMRQEQILKELLKKLELPAKPNVSVDFDSLRYIAPHNQRVQAMLEQSRREQQRNNNGEGGQQEEEEEHRRVRKSIQQWRRRNPGEGSELEEGVDYFPALYETEREQPAQTSYILAEGTPVWFDQQNFPAAVFTFAGDLRKKFVVTARLNVFLRRPEQFEYGRLSTHLNIFQRFSNGTLGPKLVSKHLELSFDSVTAYEQVELLLDSLPVQEWIESGPAQFAPQRSFVSQTCGGSVECQRNAEEQIEGEEVEEERGGRRRDELEEDENIPSRVALYVEAMYEGENLVQYPEPLASAGEEEEEEEGENRNEEENAHLRENDEAFPSANAARMFFELELVNLKGGRSRRNANTCKDNSNNTKCCLYDLIIDFEKIGWRFVIAPKRYNAYVCSGECTGVVNGAQFTRAQAAQSAKIEGFQCCHPKAYNGITILFVNDKGNVMIREVLNMVAKDCGCQ